MFHSADLLGTGFTLMGSGHAFLPAFTPADLLGAIQDRGVTWTMLAPTMIIMTLQQEDLSDYDLSSLRAFLYGSAPMAATGPHVRRGTRAARGRSRSRPAPRCAGRGS